jgi:hypothetical protein
MNHVRPKAILKARFVLKKEEEERKKKVTTALFIY